MEFGKILMIKFSFCIALALMHGYKIYLESEIIGLWTTLTPYLVGRYDMRGEKWKGKRGREWVKKRVNIIKFIFLPLFSTPLLSFLLFLQTKHAYISLRQLVILKEPELGLLNFMTSFIQVSNTLNLKSKKNWQF